jgi:hypothetical protein
MKPHACKVPEPAPRTEAAIYRSFRDLMIKAHCVRKTEAHRCQGAITITADSITFNCRLCGDLRQIVREPKPPRVLVSTERDGP